MTRRPSKTGRKTPQVEHKGILAACVERDVRKATALLQTHIEHTQSALTERPRRAAVKLAG